jgi:hypothetical protein
MCCASLRVPFCKFRSQRFVLEVLAPAISELDALVCPDSPQPPAAVLVVLIIVAAQQTICILIVSDNLIHVQRQPLVYRLLTRCIHCCCALDKSSRVTKNYEWRVTCSQLDPQLVL